MGKPITVACCRSPDFYCTACSQLALVGMSVKKDVLELLEKRVSSRFSHQRLLVSEPVLPQPPRAGTAASSPAGATVRCRRRAAAPVPRGAPLAVLAAMLRLGCAPGAAVAGATAEALAAPVVGKQLGELCSWRPGEAHGARQHHVDHQA